MRDVVEWLERATGSAVVTDAKVRWQVLSAQEQPVVTLFGAYDTGKTSIIRRLLSDRGLAIPDELTVSARHETFETALVDFGDFVVRDTPGISPEGADVRAESNSQSARDAAALTDVLVVVLNPQLVTGERDELLRVVNDGWPHGSLWFVISRADEGGADPMSDPEGFAEWADRKKAELVASLPAAAGRPVFVVVADYGAAQDETIWQMAREWDGVDRLQAQLASLASVDLGPLRDGAARRYWTGVVRSLMTEFRGGLPDLETAQRAAELSSRRRQTFDTQLTALRESAQAAVEVAVDESVRTLLLTGGTSAEAISEVVEGELGKWWLAQNAEIKRVRGEAISALDSQDSSAGWRVLQGVYRSVGADRAPTDDHALRVSPLVAVLADKAHQTGKGVQEVMRTSEALRKPSKARKLLEETSDAAENTVNWAGRVAVGLGVLDAAVPLVAWAAQAYDERREAARQREARAYVEAEVSKIAETAGAQAMARLDPEIHALREEIAANTTGPELAEALQSDVNRVRRLIGEGEVLVAEASPS